MSKELREFLAAWLAWSDKCKAAGCAVGHDYFKPFEGLCNSADRYYGLFDRQSMNKGRALRRQLQELLVSTMGESAYPFGHSAYSRAANDKRMWSSPSRRSWVRKQLENAQ